MMLMLALPVDAVRYVVVFDFAVLLFCGVAVREAFKAVVPRALSLLALLFGLVYVLVAIAVVVNVVSPIPPTPGVKFLSWPLTAITAAVAGASGWVFASRART